MVKILLRALTYGHFPSGVLVQSFFPALFSRKAFAFCLEARPRQRQGRFLSPFSFFLSFFRSFYRFASVFSAVRANKFGKASFVACKSPNQPTDSLVMFQISVGTRGTVGGMILRLHFLVLSRFYKILSEFLLSQRRGGPGSFVLSRWLPASSLVVCFPLF